MDSKIGAHLTALNDPREGVRIFAARKLAQYAAEAAPVLIERLKEKDGPVLESAAMALLEMGQGAIPFLVEALQSQDRTIRWQAAAILSAMGEQAHKAVRDSQRCIKLEQSAAAS